jgi:hypothetical protein
MFLRSSQPVARRQEFAADQVAARYAGRDTTANALRAVPMIGAAHRHYLRTYVGMGTKLGMLPPVGEVHGGFRRLLAARSDAELVTLAAGERKPRPHAYDSHPPMAERIARIEELPEDGRADASAHEPTALALLRDADQVFAELEVCALPPEVARLRRLSWDDLVMVRALADADGWSKPLRVAVARALRSEAGGRAGGEIVADAELPDLAEVLDAIDRGLLWTEVAGRMPVPDQASRLTGESARNFVRPRVFDGLAGMVHLHLVRAGRAAPDIAWSGVPGIALPAAWEAGMDDALDAAVSDTPDTAPLRTLLASTEQAPAR